jgi:glycine hydroxymethyltransferase
MTTRGFDVEEMRQVGAWIGAIVRSPDDEELLARIRGQVTEMCAGFPLPGVERDATVR